MNIEIACVIGPMMLNYLLLSFRDNNWVNKYKWFVMPIPFLVGFVGFFFFNSHQLKDSDFAFWGLMTPLLFLLVDNGFKRLSQLINNRDYYLWMRGSPGLGVYKAADRLISIFMIFFIMVLMFLPVLINKIK